MNGIQIGDEFLDLSKDTTVDLVLRNPIFGDDNIILDSYSLPFTAPGGDACEKNSRLLKNPDVIENIEASRDIPGVRYWYDGIFLKKGKLQVDNANERDKYNLNFLFGLATLPDDFKTAKLADICSEVMTLADNAYTKKVSIICRTTTMPGTYTIVINGRPYSATNNNDLAFAINADLTEPRAKAIYVPTPHPDYAAESGNYFTIEPFANADNILTPFTIELEGILTSWSDPNVIIDPSEFEEEYNGPIKDVLDTLFYQATPADSRLFFPMIWNGGLYEDAKIKTRLGTHYGVVNAVYSGDGYFMNKPADLEYALNRAGWDSFNGSSLAPMVRLSWVMEEIAEHFGIQYEGDFFDDPDYGKAFFYHSNTLDIEIPFIGSTGVNWIASRRSFNLNEFVPDWTALDLFKSLQNRFNLSVYYNERTNKIRFQKRNGIVQSLAYTEISHIASPAAPPKLNQLKGIRIEAEKDSDDKLAVDDFYSTGEPGTTIKTQISGMAAQGTVMSVYSLPLSDRRADTSIPGVLAFYQWKDAGAYDYPSANINLADGDFKFSGVTGLIENRWKSYVNFLLKRKLVTIKCDFDVPDFNRLDWEHKVRFDRLNYLYNTIKIKLTNRRIEAAEVEMYTV
jgi:hypothetical protein